MSRLPKTISVEKLDNSVLFTFAQNQHYLYDGTIEVPFNSLSIIADKSEAITLRKSASNDIFISAPWQNFDINASSKEDAVDVLTEMLYDEAGISQEEVQDMIDAATSGIPSSQVVEQLRTDVNTISGDVANKQDRLVAGDNITISGNVISAEAGNNIIELTQAEYDALTEKDPDALYIITDAQEINMNDYWTSAQTKSYVDGKVDDALDNYYDKNYVDAALGDKADNTTVNSIAAQATQAILSLSGEVQTKLDASAYTPTDLSEYWTSAQTQSAIDAATSGIPSSQVIEQLRTDVNTISGKVDGNAADIIDIYDTIDLKEEVIASALTEVRQDVADIDAKEEVIASALTEVRQNKQDKLSAGTGIEISGNVISTTGGGALFVDFDDLMNNMNDEKWDELVNALQNNKPIFYSYDYSEGDTTDAGQNPVDGYVYINETEGEEGAEIGLNRMYSGGWNGVVITKNGSEDYEVAEDGFDYQPYGEYQEALEAGSGISIDGNVISVTGASITVDTSLDSGSTNPVANSAITNAIIDDEEVISRAINDLNDRLVAVESGGSVDLSEYWTSAQTKNYVDAATSGGSSVTVDTSLDSGSTNPVANSAITTAIDGVKAYYVDFTTLTTQGIHDADWDGLVAAINAHRPIYAGLGDLYYTAECLYQDGGNRIIMTASDHNSHYFYTFTKNGSENYGFDYVTRPYVTQAEKNSWNTVSGKVETSSITSSITSASTNAEVAGAKAVYDAIDAKADASTTYTKTEVNNLVNNKFWCGTQAQYDALATKENDVLYLIHE